MAAVTDPKTPAPPEKEDAPCASVTSGSSEGSATPDGASDEENAAIGLVLPKLPALDFWSAADEAPADDATPEQAEADDASDDDDKAPEQAATDEDGPPPSSSRADAGRPAAAETVEDAADENDAAAEDADDATPEKAASDDDAPKPQRRSPSPVLATPASQGKAWDPDQGRWATQVDESDDDETLDVMRQRASRSASVEEDLSQALDATESLEDVESRFLGGARRPRKGRD